MRPLDRTIDTLLLSADYLGLYTELSTIKVYEPTDFHSSISYIDHIKIAINSWSLYYVAEDLEVGYQTVLPSYDLYLLGLFNRLMIIFIMMC